MSKQENVGLKSAVYNQEQVINGACTVYKTMQRLVSTVENFLVNLVNKLNFQQNFRIMLNFHLGFWPSLLLHASKWYEICTTF